MDVLRKIFEPVDIKIQDIQERIHLRKTKKVCKSPSTIEKSEKALMYDMWIAREGIESEMKKCFEGKDVQAWLSALETINFEKSKTCIQFIQSGEKRVMTSYMKLRSCNYV